MTSRGARTARSAGRFAAIVAGLFVYEEILVPLAILAAFIPPFAVGAALIGLGASDVVALVAGGVAMAAEVWIGFIVLSRRRR